MDEIDGKLHKEETDRLLDDMARKEKKMDRETLKAERGEKAEA